MANRWYLLIHQLPVRPIYLRAKVRQQLARAGAVALKNSVYVLPSRGRCLDAFRAVAAEAAAGGGDVSVCEARFVSGMTTEELVRQFRAARTTDYDALAKDIRGEMGKLEGARRPALDAELAERLARLKARWEEIRAIDFFPAPTGRKVPGLLASLERRLRRVTRQQQPGGPASHDLVGRTWVTRRGLHVDRLASAWLVRRFIDPNARFRFVDPGYAGRSSAEIRFDMVPGDFTHEQDRCTFETIVHRAKISDPAVSQIAQIVHDIDLKDGKFGRPETRGIELLLLGILLAHPQDEDRLARGFTLFDDLEASLRKQPRVPARHAPRA